ncbi:hypothetical protein GCM10020295_66730 [Streptomyces cinereospinus]
MVSPDRADLDHGPGSPDEWWAALRQALALLAEAEGGKTTARDGWSERAFPQFLGVPAAWVVAPQPEKQKKTPSSTGVSAGVRGGDLNSPLGQQPTTSLTWENARRQSRHRPP